jgi:Zn-dependent M28 family amino/carboxypeptidase
VDDVSNGLRLWRRVTAEERTTWNVVAQCGDANAQRTLVVLSHHDAAQTGAVFDQSFQVWASRRFPGILSRFDTSLPLWWPVTAAPALVTLGAASNNRRLAAAGAAGCAAATALALDIARSPVTPGANDNLSGVAALVELANRLRSEPVSGLRVLLVSCGAEEVLQGGIYGFAARHFPRLELDRTAVLCLESIGSPELFILEGEGCFVMEEYPVASFRDLIEHVAGRLGRPLRRGCRSRSSTDAVIPARAGYPTATLCSWDPHTKCISNYHLMSDTPDNVDYGTVRRAVDVTEALVRELASSWWIGPRSAGD